jgi:hypothetical protein
MQIVYHVMIIMIHVVMRMQNLVLEKVVIIYLNVTDHRFLFRHYIVEHKNLVNNFFVLFLFYSKIDLLYSYDQ